MRAPLRLASDEAAREVGTLIVCPDQNATQELRHPVHVSGLARRNGDNPYLPTWEISRDVDEEVADVPFVSVEELIKVAPLGVLVSLQTLRVAEHFPLTVRLAAHGVEALVEHRGGHALEKEPVVAKQMVEHDSDSFFRKPNGCVTAGASAASHRPVLEPHNTRRGTDVPPFAS